ncbi:MAG: amino acid permease [Actinobacteria bacterium]|nr:amino acid permease [Actinomycetota bacterium]MCB9412996.1 amino acid permease [Actinomycetota bacterium]
MSTVDSSGGNVATAEPGGGSGGGSLGLSAAAALVMGSIIGTGVFLLPASLAAFGTISLLAFVFTAIGAIALAQMFGVLSKRMPADGGPYAYSRAAFGNAVGFFNAWSYWITAWAGNAAIVVAWIVYVEVFINTGHNKVFSIVIGFVGLWLPAAVNLSGVKNMASVQIITTIIKFIPLVIISTVGLFFVDWSYLTSNWNISGQAPLAAIVTCMALAVFSYLGVETAAVAAGKVRNPRRNVPLASLLGTLACTVVYLLSTLVIFGTVPNKELTADGAQPFTLSFNAMFGGTWSGYAVAIAAIISGLGALNGWTMICAEMPLAAAREGLFPRQFAKLSGKGVPAFGIIASTGLASALMIFSYLGQAGADVFNLMILLAGLTAAVPYAFSALALIKWSFRAGERTQGANWRFDGVIAVVGLLFSALIIYGSFTDPSTVVSLMILSVVVFVLGLVLYFYMRRKFTAVESAAPPS